MGQRCNTSPWQRQTIWLTIALMTTFYMLCWFIYFVWFSLSSTLDVFNVYILLWQFEHTCALFTFSPLRAFTGYPVFNVISQCPVGNYLGLSQHPMWFTMGSNTQQFHNDINHHAVSGSAPHGARIGTRAVVTQHPEAQKSYACSDVVRRCDLLFNSAGSVVDIMVVLKGIPAVLSPELLFALAQMGHGDELGMTFDSTHVTVVASQL